LNEFEYTENIDSVRETIEWAMTPWLLVS